mmetsp:Transcript_30872/g.60808  ORF Transcript_30872/g.60808 Transcript_30872/m.60808 type:complete len:155 (+) Transcript_30872:152-616(+)
MEPYIAGLHGVCVFGKPQAGAPTRGWMLLCVETQFWPSDTFVIQKEGQAGRQTGIETGRSPKGPCSPCPSLFLISFYAHTKACSRFSFSHLGICCMRCHACMHARTKKSHHVIKDYDQMYAEGGSECQQLQKPGEESNEGRSQGKEARSKHTHM